ncbi:ATP-binding cassette domain-containing protein [Candidatus Palauibacter sp.]|uniref:ATP-binding cassette domain-containing protein n=1 Tax=Candidatus Palauibacter sp. TaxID=3101350 RepID=UPI003AF289F4
MIEPASFAGTNTSADFEIELCSFSVKYPLFELEPLNIRMMAGERVALVGPNGAGKTTILRALSGSLPEYGGKVLFGGTDSRALFPGLRNHVGVMPERLLGFDWMTVRQHFDLLAEFFDRWDRDYEAELMDRLEICEEGCLGTLSSGNRAKVAFVSAEAFRPRVLLLDEPTSGLDPVMRKHLINAVVENLDNDQGRIVLFSTHILEDVEWLAERVLVLRNGSLIADRPVPDMRTDGKSLTGVLYALMVAK